MTDTFTFEGKNRIYIGAKATLIEEEREIASDWAANHIKINPAYAWVLGRYVESDKANNNGQYFTLDTLKSSQDTVLHAPMNMNHAAKDIVGTFVANELVYPEQADLNPYIENLGVFWKYYFKDEYYAVKSANDAGTLFYSMECLPTSVSTVGGTDDSKMYAYEGRTSSSYPPELNERSVPMNIHDPHFVAGALIIPPVRPGWSAAKVSQVANFYDECWKEAEMAYDSISNAAPDLQSHQWEAMMADLIAVDAEAELARQFNQSQRMGLAKTGAALPDGSFPIANVDDLKNAIHAIGRAKDPAKAKSHIKARAKALGKAMLIPKGW